MSRSTVLSPRLRAAGASRPLPLVYKLLRPPVRAALARWFDLRVEGLEQLPAAGPYLVAANHHNYLDGVVLAAALPEPIGFLVMPRVWRATPLHPWLHRRLGSIPLEVERPDVGALRRALRALEDGRVVGIFPEGPFSVCGRLERGLPGVGLLAAHADLATGYALLQRFCRLVADARDSGLAPFQALANGLAADRAAGEAALTTPWSTGPVEGHVHRVRLLWRPATGAPSSTCFERGCSPRPDRVARHDRLQAVLVHANCGRSVST